MKKGIRVLNTIMITVVTFFLCRSVFYIWDYFANPDAYAMWSSPWYTAMLWLGAFTLVVVVVCSVIKAVIKYRIQKEESTPAE